MAKRKNDGMMSGDEMLTEHTPSPDQLTTDGNKVADELKPKDMAQVRAESMIFPPTTHASGGMYVVKINHDEDAAEAGPAEFANYCTYCPSGIIGNVITALVDSKIERRQTTLLLMVCAGQSAYCVPLSVAKGHRLKSAKGLSMRGYTRLVEWVEADYMRRLKERE